MNKYLILFIFISMLLSGCGTFTSKQATQAVPPKQDIAKQHLANLQHIKRWSAEGKIKLTVNQSAHSAAFKWKQFNNNYSIHFFGPFGLGSTWLRRTSKGVTLESSNEPIQRAANAEELLLKQTGWQVPVSNLQYWIKGQPAPSIPVKNAVLDTSGAYLSFEQQGWQLLFSRHQAKTLHSGLSAVQLPGKLIATRDNLKVLAVLKQWEL